MSTSRVYVAGQVLTAAQMNDLPQGVLGKTSITTDVSTSAGTEITFVTAPAVTIAGTNRRLRISFHCQHLDCTVANDTYTLRIKEGATVLSTALVTFITTSGEPWPSDFTASVDSPTAGSHTYSITMQRTSGTGAATARSGGFSTFILVEDVGAV